MKNWKKLISAGLALGLVLTNVPQNTSVVYAQENGTLQNITFEQEQEAVQNAPITVQKVNGLSKDFVNGVDVSSYLSLVESGAKYYDEKGDEADLFDLLENAGVNYVRLRVWNDPFPWDEDGNYKYVGADGTTEYKAAAVTQAGISVNGVQQYCLVDDPDTPGIPGGIWCRCLRCSNRSYHRKESNGSQYESADRFPLQRFLGRPKETACTKAVGGYELRGKDQCSIRIYRGES